MASSRLLKQDNDNLSFGKEIAIKELKRLSLDLNRKDEELAKRTQGSEMAYAEIKAELADLERSYSQLQKHHEDLWANYQAVLAEHTQRQSKDDAALAQQLVRVLGSPSGSAILQEINMRTLRHDPI